MDKVYSRINWQNQPSTATALGATNLNKMDISLNVVDDRIIQLDTAKLDISTANTMLAGLEVDSQTGVIKATLLNGTMLSWDLNLEKIPIKLSLTEDAVLVLDTDDGQSYTADLKGLIDTYVFNNSDTIGFETTSNKNVTAIIKKGSITNDHLRTDYLADITEQQLLAEGFKKESEQQALVSKRYAIGGVVPEDAKDNSKYYAERAKNAQELTQQIADINYPEFRIDFLTGELIMERAKGIIFSIDQEGNLNVEVNT